jgi:deoxyribodipyrimidine photo-lyase
MTHLVDGDLASNNGGWQWAAGTGTDAAPYFRIFNPTLQSVRFDPVGRYVRRWCPELTLVTDDFIHRPAEAPPSLLAEAGVTLGREYPHPIVDHAERRGAAIEMYAAAKAGQAPGTVRSPRLPRSRPGTAREP